MRALVALAVLVVPLAAGASPARFVDYLYVEANEGGSSGGVMPITLVMNLFEALKAAKSHQSPWLGVSVLELQTLRRQVATQKRAPASHAPHWNSSHFHQVDPTDAAYSP